MTNPLPAAEARANPFETPRPRNIRMTQGVLRVAVAVQCFGYAVAHLHQKLPDQVCDYFLTGSEWPPDQVARISDFVAYGLIVCGVLTLLRPTLPVLLALFAYAIGHAVATGAGADSLSERLASALQATQIVTPLALMLIDFWPPRIKPTLPMCLSSTLLLKLAVTVSFVAHGILCCEQARAGGPMWELFKEAAHQTFRGEVSVESLRSFMAIWGGVEIGFALALLTSRSRPAMAGCVAVGWFMAFLPIIAGGQKSYHESMIMASLAAAPLALLTFHLTCVREQPPIYLPDRS